MYAVPVANRLTTIELEARLQLYIKHCKNGRTVSHKNGSVDRSSACLATNKQDISWFMQYSFQTGFRLCLYKTLGL